MFRILPLVCCLIALSCAAGAQGTISGRVTDRGTWKAITTLQVRNVYTSETVQGDTGGNFKIAAASGELIEISAPGYTKQSIRIPGGNAPRNYALTLLPAPPEIPEANDPRSRYSRDSTSLYANYKRALALEKLTGLYAVYSPFSALSRRNRQIWRFQDEFYAFEQEKFIDYVFSDSLVQRVTGLSGDSLARYKRFARPSYERARLMSDAAMYAYIRESANAWRRRQSGQRSAQ